MEKYLKILLILSLILVGWLYLPMNLQAEFYRYVDNQGRIYYVDDLSKIPEEYQGQVKVYRERYDDLSETDRSKALEIEQERRQQHELQQVSPPWLIMMKNSSRGAVKNTMSNYRK